MKPDRPRNSSVDSANRPVRQFIEPRQRTIIRVRESSRTGKNAVTSASLSTAAKFVSNARSISQTMIISGSCKSRNRHGQRVMSESGRPQRSSRRLAGSAAESH